MLSIFLMSFLLLLCFLLFLPNAPLLYLILLLLYSLCISILMNMFLSPWLMISISLIFLGGMMVIFSYVTTLASTEKMLYMNLSVIFFLMISLVMMKKNIIKSLYATNFPLLYEMMSGDIMFFITFYLLLSLFLVVKVSSWEMGSLSYK